MLNAEVVVVDKALKRFCGILHRTHFDSATKAIEDHRDHGIARLPVDGAVFGVIDDRPNAGLGLDDGLISVRVVLGDEVVDGGILVEVIGGVGLAFGGGTVSDIVVIVRDLIGRNKFIADVVAILLAILRGAATEEIIDIGISGIGGIGDGGGENGGSAFCPFLQYFFKDGGFHVHSVHRGLLRLVKYPL